MKATLEFNLPEEQEEYEAAIKGRLYKTAYETLYEEVFRPHLKYNKEFDGKALTEEECLFLFKIIEKIDEHFDYCLKD